MSISVNDVLPFVVAVISLTAGLLRYFQIELIDAPRTKILESLSLVNREVKSFTEVMWNPENLPAERKSLRDKILWFILPMLQILIAGLILLETLFFASTNNAVFWFAIVTMSLFFLSDIILRGLSKLSRNIDSRNPRRNWIVVCYFARSVDNYIGIAIIIFVFAFIIDFSNLISVLSALVMTVPVFFIYSLYMNKRRQFRGIENEIFERNFQGHEPFVELTLKNASVPVAGLMTNIADSLIIRREDGFREVIRWNEIVTIADRQNIS